MAEILYNIESGSVCKLDFKFFFVYFKLNYENEIYDFLKLNMCISI